MKIYIRKLFKRLETRFLHCRSVEKLFYIVYWITYYAKKSVKINILIQEAFTCEFYI